MHIRKCVAKLNRVQIEISFLHTSQRLQVAKTSVNVGSGSFLLIVLSELLVSLRFRENYLAAGLRESLRKRRILVSLSVTILLIILRTRASEVFNKLFPQLEESDLFVISNYETHCCT